MLKTEDNTSDLFIFQKIEGPTLLIRKLSCEMKDCVPQAESNLELR